MKVDKKRRIVCDEHLRCRIVEHILALGDCAAVRDTRSTKLLPATAQVAHQQADFLIRRLSASDRTPDAAFRFRSRGTLVSLGGDTAAGQFPTPGRTGPIILDGVVPKLFYSSLQLMHRAALSGWPQACALSLADRLRRVGVPPVKLY